MTKAEFMEGIHMLQDNYNKKYTVNQLRLIYESLKDMNTEQYIKNIKEHIKSSQYLPNIAQIRRENQNKQYANFEQRDYSKIDFNKIFTIKQI